MDVKTMARMGGLARAKKLSRTRRKEIAAMGAEARLGKGSNKKHRGNAAGAFGRQDGKPAAK